MAIYKKGYYDLYMFQGDTGNIRVNGIPPTRDYTIYFQINDMNGRKILELEPKQSNYHREVVFTISSEISDSLSVGQYCYAVKLCYYDIEHDITSEETVIPLLKNTSSLPNAYKNKALFSVYPKQIEGVDEESY